MPETLWFPLRKVAALVTTPHHTHAFRDLIVVYCDQHTVRLHDPSHDCQARHGMWPSCPHDVHPVGCGGGRVEPGPYMAVFGRWALLPLDTAMPDGRTLSDAVRRGIAAGGRWLAISVDFDGRLYPVIVARRSRIPRPGTKWTPALVHADGGRYGPYPALVADQHRHAASVVPVFTRETVEAVASDIERYFDDPVSPVIQVGGHRLTITHPASGADHVLEATSFGYLPLPGHWVWEIANPHTWGDPHRPWPCTCHTSCPYCDQPVGDAHDPYCLRLYGERVGNPRTRAASLEVTDEHRHQPGCPHTKAPRWPLFTPVGPFDEQCGHCAAVNTCDRMRFDSYGGTTESVERCEHCGASRGYVNMSAVM